MLDGSSGKFLSELKQAGAGVEKRALLKEKGINIRKVGQEL